MKEKLLLLFVVLTILPVNIMAYDYRLKVGDTKKIFLKDMLNPTSTWGSDYTYLKKVDWRASGDVYIFAKTNEYVEIKADKVGSGTVDCDAYYTKKPGDWDSRKFSGHKTIECYDDNGGGGGGGGGGEIYNGDKNFEYNDNVTSSTEEGVSMTFWIHEEISSKNKKWPCSVMSDDPFHGKAAISKSTSGKVTIPEIVPGTKGCSVKNMFGQTYLDLDGLIVTIISVGAFYECQNITEVVIPSSVQSITTQAFDGCTSLKKITLKASSPPEVENERVFMSDAYNTVTIWVPKGAKSAYKNANVWKKFNNIKEEGEPDVITPTGITISPSSNTIKVGESFQASYTLTPSNATTTVTWTSDNSSIASVDKNTGKVTGVKAGSTYINATTSNGKTNRCRVTVESSPVSPTAISVSPSSKTIKVGETFTPTYTLTPSNATTTVTWTSDDSRVASVDRNTGKVTGVKAGTTYINATTANGKTNYVKVTVNNMPKLQLSASPVSGEVEKGTVVKLTAKANGSAVSADIYYTLNGATPSKSSTPYTSAGITINSDCTIKAIAYKDGYDTSSVITEKYNVKNKTVELTVYNSIIDGELAQEFATVAGVSGGKANNNVDGKSIIVIKKGNATVTAVGGTTPANDNEIGGAAQQIIPGAAVAGKENTYKVKSVREWNDIKWERKAQGDIDFWYITGTGNPYVNMYAVQNTKDGKLIPDSYKAEYQYYEPDGSVGMPVTGLYYKFMSTVRGSFKVKVWSNKGNRKTFVVNSKNMKAQRLYASGYINGVNDEYGNKKLLSIEQVDSVHHVYIYGDYEKAVQTGGKTKRELADMKEEADKMAVERQFVIGNGNQNFWGWLTFDVEAGEEYWVFQHSSQIGFGGFEFYEGESMGINSFVMDKVTKNNSIYSLSGQRLDTPRKGINIINGKKVVIK